MSKKLRSILVVMVISLFFNGIFAQDILMTIGDKEISVDEFERIYNKNNNSITDNQQTPEEYLELFINFKLKVLEAENLGMDTTKKFLREFNSYKEQLAQPYLTDEETKEYLMKQAYERMKYDVHVSHILLGMGSQLSPEDTLIRYNRAMDIRQRIIDGEDFATVAKATSDDPGARINGGDLGYFTVFQMLYPFESAAYELEDGEVSMPVRTLHGYHIIKKHDTRPAVGQVKVAHIFLAVPEGSSHEEQVKARSDIMAIRDSIDRRADFGALAKRHSDDKNSAANGGELPWFGTSRMIKEFENAAFSLEKPGDVSRAFRSYYGWHIVKLIDKKEVGTYEEMESELQSKALKGDRERVRRKIQLDKLKEKYNYELNSELYKKLYTLVDSSIFFGEWDPYKNTNQFEDYLFTMDGGFSVTLGRFVAYLDSIQKRRGKIPVENFVDIMFNRFTEEYIMNIEMASLPERFPEYRYILQEYHDGILLFDLMNEKVWNKAVQDTAGLEKFFNSHRDDYMWSERTEAILVSCDSATDVEAIRKKSRKIEAGRWDEKKLNKKFCDSDTLKCITLDTILAEPGENELLDALQNDGDTGEIFSEEGKLKFMIRKGTVAPMHKQLDEVRGQATSDYQDDIEKQWIKKLREKYKVVVNEELLSKVERKS
ncbi:MAG: peptidylprolyl isomerase [Bacteroidales bacterium]|nr:peptidylprolyl isomerase [Bacteroidales bacterium]